MKKFLQELKRRRVLHTASLYVVGAWIALQVTEVLAGAGLPPSTMRYLLVLLSLGFPIALITGWFFDISKEGISKTGPLPSGEELPQLKFIDHVLLAGLLVVVAADAFVLYLPPPDEHQVLVSSGSKQRIIAVLGFEDSGLAEGDDPVGEALAGELRSSLTRIPGLRVLGPETSKALEMAGENRLSMAGELFVSVLLLGEVLLDDRNIEVQARLVTVPAGNELWSHRVEGLVAESIELQQGLVRRIAMAVAPNLDPGPAQGPRAEAGACSEVYDLYLRGKQLAKARKQTEAKLFNRGMELLREAVDIDPECALAWEAIASAEVNWTMPGFVKAGAAARRALELNDALPEAWAVLAEIAEEEERWSESEEYFLRALYADPTNAHANFMYSETLSARGRARDALHYALEAYRYEPASSIVNFRVTFAAVYAGESDLAITHAGIVGDIDGEMHPWVIDSVAESYLQKGDTDRALETYDRISGQIAQWFPDCVRVREQADLAPAVLGSLQETLEQYKTNQLSMAQAWSWGWNIMRCSIWLDEPDIVFELMNIKGVAPFENGMPTEVKFINLFHPDGRVIRQDPRFHKMVVESGLLNYWKKWGWPDLCRPDGDGFICH